MTKKLTVQQEEIAIKMTQEIYTDPGLGERIKIQIFALQESKDAEKHKQSDALKLLIHFVNKEIERNNVLVSISTWH